MSFVIILILAWANPVGWSNWLEGVELDLICVLKTKQLKQHIQCWPLIRQAVSNEGPTDVVDAKKDV